MKNRLTFVTAIIFLALLSSCNKSAKVNSAQEKLELDSAVYSPDDTGKNVEGMGEDTQNKMTPDIAMTESNHNNITNAKPPITATTPPPDNSQNTQGTFVYYCPGRMLENTDNNVSVTITKTALSQAIDQLEKRIAKTTGKQVESIHKDIAGSSIAISAKMKVELKSSGKDFETIYKPENDDQVFDGTNDMNWGWIIRPMKVGNVQLSIVVSAYDQKNGRWLAVQTPPKIFNIKVQVDPRGYFAKLWGFLEKNPEWLFIQILFPLVTFFFGRSRGKKSS